MKRNFFLLFSICTIMFSCEKESASTNNHMSLIGVWKLKSSCGGFTGECDYPNENFNKILEIKDSRIAEYTNGTNSFTFNYTIKSQLIQDDYIDYELQFNNQIYRFRIDKSELQFERGDFVETYTRK